MKKYRLLFILVLTLFTFTSTAYTVENLTLGEGAGNAFTTATDNTTYGDYAFELATTAAGNVTLGMFAGRSHTTALGCIYLGYLAGADNTTSSHKLYINTGWYPTNGIFGDFSTGFFGINNTSPSVALDITGDLSISGAFDLTGALYGETINDQFSYVLAGAIFNVDPTASAIYTWMTPSDNGTEQDLSPHNLDLTYVNASDFTASDKIVKGLVWVLDFDATNDYLTAADDALWSLNGTADQPFTIGGWIQVVAHTDTQGVWDKFTGSGAEQREWAVYLDDTEKLVFELFDEADDKSSTNVTTSAVSVGWHFIAHTYDGTAGANALDEANALWYVDGVSVADTDTDDGAYTNMVGGTSLVHVGSYNDGIVGDNVFRGDMGALFLLNTELSADAIWQLYLATRGYYGE